MAHAPSQRAGLLAGQREVENLLVILLAMLRFRGVKPRMNYCDALHLEFDEETDRAAVILKASIADEFLSQPLRNDRLPRIDTGFAGIS